MEQHTPVKENAVAQRLRALTRLQVIDSQLDRIHRLRGSLPEEVGDLEDDLEGLETRRERVLADIAKLDAEISSRRVKIEEFHNDIKRYQEQQNNVKNSREFEAVNKEIEYANLEILTSEKKIRQYMDQAANKQDQLGETEYQIEEKKRELDAKNNELRLIIADTEAEERKLHNASNEAASHIEERLLKGYKRIRSNMRNGLAVVAVDRDACGGCFSIIPPQRLIELRQRTTQLQCENCGRLLVDETFFEEVKDEIQDLLSHE